MVPARRLQEGDDALGALNVVPRSRAGAALGQGTDGVRLPLRGRPLERRAVRRRPPLAFSRLARRVRLERAIDRAGIAIENVADAIGAIEVDRVEDVDVRLEDEIRRRHVPRIRRPARRRGAVLPVARPRVGAVLQEHGDRFVVAMKGRRMERRVS